MKIKTLTFILILLTISIFPRKGYATYDPREVPNNPYGIHILDPIEVETASKLVNSNGGEWGYVTVPIRSDDRDRVKWQKFFSQTKQLKVIPILRLATYGRGDTWILPSEYEMLDFANFLNQFEWPIQNRYIIVFNEINHSLEWGGYVDPKAYAEILDYTIDIFKTRSPNFFILPAALDMAAPTNDTSLDALGYWHQVFSSKPNLINKIDGWNSHAYPNPGFTALPTDQRKTSIISYQYELKYLSSLGGKNLPVFITETGWDQQKISPAKLAEYWSTAYQIWQQDNIVAITPFILQAHHGPFVKFSFLNQQNQPNTPYQILDRLPKIKGRPLLTQHPGQILSSNNSRLSNLKILGKQSSITGNISSIFNNVLKFFNNIFSKNSTPKATTTPKLDQTSQQTKNLVIGNTEIKVEIADTPEATSLGLGHRSFLPEDRGMLFIFPKKSLHRFWMKHTLFPLDIIWINDEKIVDITQNIPVEPDPANPKKLYKPKQQVNKVLEVNAGFASKNGIKIGDTVETFQ